MTTHTTTSASAAPAGDQPLHALDAATVRQIFPHMNEDQLAKAASFYGAVGQLVYVMDQVLPAEPPELRLQARANVAQIAIGIAGQIR